MTAEAASEGEGRDREPCEYCGGYGEVYGHADDCSDDRCALNGDMYSCGGKVEPCGACDEDMKK